jgi:pullulanase/glycogen debranching enzyme
MRPRRSPANRDEDSHNRSWNHGVQGPTNDPEVHALAASVARTLTLGPSFTDDYRRS